MFDNFRLKLYTVGDVIHWGVVGFSMDMLNYILTMLTCEKKYQCLLVNASDL